MIQGYRDNISAAHTDMEIVIIFTLRSFLIIQNCYLYKFALITFCIIN